MILLNKLSVIKDYGDLFVKVSGGSESPIKSSRGSQMAVQTCLVSFLALLCNCL